jgi:uncharacterized protein
MNYYVWLRLFRDPAWPAPVARIAAVTMLLLCVSLPFGFLLRRRSPQSWLAQLALVPFVWIGVSFLLLLGAVAADLVRLGMRALGAPADPERRELLRRVISGGALVVSGGLTGLAVRSARGEIVSPDVAVRLARLPRALDGFTIVQISDLHVGLTIQRPFVESIVEKANALKPDLIAITGDLVDGSTSDLAALVEPLARLRARHGVLFCSGNHDHYSGWRSWKAYLPGLGIRPLDNERIDLDGIDIAGIQDLAGRPDLAQALAGRDPERELILLAHRPRMIDAATRAGVGLQLSGHTHGGQIQPFGAFVRLSEPYIAGLHRHTPATQIYVSRGTGYWGPPMRLFAPAEIARIILVKA